MIVITKNREKKDAKLNPSSIMTTQTLNFSKNTGIIFSM